MNLHAHTARMKAEALGQDLLARAQHGRNLGLHGGVGAGDYQSDAVIAAHKLISGLAKSRMLNFSIHNDKYIILINPYSKTINHGIKAIALLHGAGQRAEFYARG